MSFVYFGNLFIEHTHRTKAREIYLKGPDQSSASIDMMTKKDQIITLDDVKVERQTPTLESYHVYGIFKNVETKSSIPFWKLVDETCQTGELFKLAGPLEHYPDPKPGDIVRIHRAFTDERYKNPVVSKGHNVIIWRAHKYEPAPITKAQKPTITNYDNERRRTLERLYCGYLDKISNINSNDPSQFYDVSGRVEAKRSDPYGNLLVTITDGTAKIDIRVFPKRLPHECSEHFEIASSAKEGDYIVVTSTKLNKTFNLDISANEHYGRSLRIVEPQSILGVILSESLGAQSVHEATTSNGLRRSPRLLAKTSATTPLNEPWPNDKPLTAPPALLGDQSSDFEPLETSPLRNGHAHVDLKRPAEEAGSNLTKLSDMTFCADNIKKFYDIAGQVKGEPIVNSFGHYVFQFFDGSIPAYSSFDIGEFNEPFENSVAIVVYRKQKDNDTNQHIEVVKKIHDGDLVLVINVRAHTKDKKLKLDLSANLTNNKSIKIVDKTSELGLRLLEQVNNPHIEELNESLNSSQELGDYDGEPPI